jgi:hypothetical protein
MNVVERRRSIEILVLLEKAYFQWYLPTADILGRKHLVKRTLISTLNRVIYFIETPLQGSPLHKI